MGFAGLHLLRRTEARSVVGTVRGVAPRRSLAGGRYAGVVTAAGWLLAALLLLPHASLLLLSFVPRNTWNADALKKSLTEIGRIAASGATVICGHDDRQWRTLRKGADAYD